MKIKIALAVLACSGALLLPTWTSAAPLSGLSQGHSIATADKPLLQKAHRWWRRGWGVGPYYGYGHGYGYGYGPGYSYYRPYYPAYRPYYYGAYYTYAPPPPPPYYYYPYWGPYY